MKHKKMKIVLSIIFLSFSLSACGKQAVETSGETETSVETEESKVEEEGKEEEETEEASSYTGYNHYIDPEEARKAAESESEKEENEQRDAADETEAASSETQEQSGAVEQAQANVPETTQSSEAAVSSESTAEPKSVLPDCALVDGEWYPPVPVFIIKDQAEVRDEPNASSGVQGRLDFGTSIGSIGRSGDYIRVSYGAKPAWIEISAISVEDPFK